MKHQVLYPTILPLERNPKSKCCFANIKKTVFENYFQILISITVFKNSNQMPIMLNSPTISHPFTSISYNFTI